VLPSISDHGNYFLPGKGTSVREFTGRFRDASFSSSNNINLQVDLSSVKVNTFIELPRSLALSKLNLADRSSSDNNSEWMIRREETNTQ
jgi:hypothetical protein